MLPSIRPVPYHYPTSEKIITFFVLRFLIYNFSAKEAFWNEGEHFSFKNESFERPLAWSRNKCRRRRSVQTELMWVEFSWLKLQFFNFNFFIQMHCIFYWLSIFIVMRFIHEPLAWMIGATPSHILTLINWLIDWLIFSPHLRNEISRSENWKFLLVDTGILGFRIRILAQRIRIPLQIGILESEFNRQ